MVGGLVTPVQSKQNKSSIFWKTVITTTLYQLCDNQQSYCYRPPGDGRLFDMKVHLISSYVFRTANMSRKSKGKMLNMLLLIREMFYYLKK